LVTPQVNALYITGSGHGTSFDGVVYLDTIQGKVGSGYNTAYSQGTFYGTGSQLFHLQWSSIDNVPSLVSSSVQINTGSFSGSITTASYAISASYALNGGGSGVSSSYSVTASYASVAQSVLGSISSATSASYALSASNAFTASFALNAPPNSFANITGKPTLVSSSVQINTGSFSGSITTASYALSASYAANAGVPVSSSYSVTSSYAV
jgi:hypothetical protein